MANTLLSWQAVSGMGPRSAQVDQLYHLFLHPSWYDNLGFEKQVLSPHFSVNHELIQQFVYYEIRQTIRGFDPGMTNN